MHILMLGAGAIGGYFGARLLSAGRPVSFLVRSRRAELLRQQGLSIRSAAGDLQLNDLSLIETGAPLEPYDLVILSCKAYDLDSAIESLRGAVGPETIVLPLLNGMRHLKKLDAAYGADQVLGGSCFISTKVVNETVIEHLSDVHAITLGARTPTQTGRAFRALQILDGCGFEVRSSASIVLEMWEKWIFLATMAGLTCLFRGKIGEIVSAGGSDVARQLYDECRQIACAAGYQPRPEAVDFALQRLTQPGSLIAASMLGDIERNGPTEGEHILGDLLSRCPAPLLSQLRMLPLAVLHLQVYELKRQKPLQGDQ